jgi:hypothetical protein
VFGQLKFPNRLSDEKIMGWFGRGGQQKSQMGDTPSYQPGTGPQQIAHAALRIQRAQVEDPDLTLGKGHPFASLMEPAGNGRDDVHIILLDQKEVLYFIPSVCIRADQTMAAANEPTLHTTDIGQLWIGQPRCSLRNDIVNCAD